MRTRKCLGIAAPLALMTLVVSGCGGTSGNGAARAQQHKHLVVRRRSSMPGLEET